MCVILGQIAPQEAEGKESELAEECSGPDPEVVQHHMS